MTRHILRVVAAKSMGSHVLDLTFNDGVRKVVSLEPLLKGPVFETLRSPEFFDRVTLDQTCGTVVWPNGADFAPEALYELEPCEAAGS